MSDLGDMMHVARLLPRAQHLVRLARAGEPIGELVDDLQREAANLRDTLADPGAATSTLSLLQEGLDALERGDVDQAATDLRVDVQAPKDRPVFAQVADAIRLARLGGHPDVDAIRATIDRFLRDGTALLAEHHDTPSIEDHVARTRQQMAGLARFHECCDLLEAGDPDGAEVRLQELISDVQDC